MPEPTSTDRLAQIRDRSERLAAIPLETSTENRIMRNMIDSIGDVRWLLEVLGEAWEEWAADGPGGWMQDPTGTDSKRYARNIVNHAAERGVTVKLKRRLVGKWHDVEREAELRLECGCLGFCEGGPECLDDEGGPWPQEREAPDA